MLFSDKCPHCDEKTDVEKPFGEEGGDETVEFQQECSKCGESFVAVFRVEYVLQEVRRC